MKDCYHFGQLLSITTTYPPHQGSAMSINTTHEIQRQLEEAVQNQRRMKEEHRKMLHKVATSPVKQKKPAPKQEQQEVVDVAAVFGPGEKKQTTSVLNIPAYRPSYKSEEVKACSPEATHTSSTECSDTTEDACPEKQYESPAFLTRKKKAMHCELDDPGYDIPFPKNTLKKNVFQRLLACFHKPSIYSPPRVVSHRPRPPSSGLVPPLLSLENEVAPLKSSMCGYDNKEMCMVTAREESFESLVAEASEAGDTPKIQKLVAKQDEIAESIAPVHEKEESLATVHPIAQKGRDYSSRLSKTSVTGTEIKSAVGIKSKLSSPLKPPKNLPRMTKAAIARNEANRKKIEQRILIESAHFDAMPTAIKRASMPMGDQKSFLPKLRESLATFDTAKQASIESAAVKVLFPRNVETEERHADAESISSDRNHMMSLSFTEDPFYKELAKIDHTLTQDDLDKLREALLVMD